MKRTTVATSLFFVFGLLGCYSSSHAQTADTIVFSQSSDRYVSDLENRVDRLEAQLASYDSESNSRRPHVAASYLETNRPPGMIFNADLLCWNVRTPGREYAISDIGGVQDRGAVGQVLTLNGDYGAGFRFAVGRRFQGSGGNGGTELLFTYTDFDILNTEQYAGSMRSVFVSSDNSENDDSDNINTLGVETITPDDRATGASASWDFDYATYDLQLGQNLIATESYNLRVATTLRYADIDDRYRVTYTGGDFQTAFTSFHENDYHGGGLLVGMDFDKNLMQRLTLDAGFDVGMMIGEMETRTFIPDDEPGVPTDVTFKDDRVSPTLETSIGLTYRHPFQSMMLAVSAGYEMSTWFNMSDERVFSDSHQEGQNVHLLNDFTLDGAYIRLGVNY